MCRGNIRDIEVAAFFIVMCQRNQINCFFFISGLTGIIVLQGIIANPNFAAAVRMFTQFLLCVPLSQKQYNSEDSLIFFLDLKLFGNFGI